MELDHSEESGAGEHNQPEVKQVDPGLAGKDPELPDYINRLVAEYHEIFTDKPGVVKDYELDLKVTERLYLCKG